MKSMKMRKITEIAKMLKNAIIVKITSEPRSQRHPYTINIPLNETIRAWMVAAVQPRKNLFLGLQTFFNSQWSYN